MPSAPEAAAVASRPNIVILVSDDQRWDTITPTFMPNVWNNLVNRGTLFPASRSTTFTNAFVPNPLCCPSRTSILTGRYSHSTGVYSNGWPFGGFAAFDDRHTMATDFHDAGYRTALIGKYLNGYLARSNTYVPPGWDRWFEVSTGAFYNYYVSSNGRTLFHADAPADYVTRVLSDQAISFVRDAADGGDPFLLYYSFTAPHDPAIPQPIDAGRFASVPLPQPPSYNLVDDPTGAGKPWFIRDQPEQDATLFHERQLESTYGIDRAIGQLLNVLPPNTIVAYLSDNGMSWGEHRWVGKVVPYNESIRIPMILTSLDGSFSLPSSTSNDIVLNVDLRPTLEAAASVPLGTSAEGLDWERDPPRSAFVLEHGGDEISYCGAREVDWMYARYSDGFEELYNESADPYELNNLRTDPVAAGDQAAYERLSAEAVAMCRPRPPGVVLGTTRLIGGRPDQSSAFQNADWLTWTTNSVAHPKLYEAVAKKRGASEKVRLNQRGTRGHSGNLIPGSSWTIYSQRSHGTSDLFFMNLNTGRRRAVRGVNTTASEHNGLASADYVLFDRDHFVGDIRWTDLRLYNRRDGSTVRLGSWRTSAVKVLPGFIGESYAAYSLVDRNGSRSFIYAIAGRTRLPIPVGSGRSTWGPTIDERGGWVYFARSGTGCGVDVSIRRVALAALDGTQTTLTILAPGSAAQQLSLGASSISQHMDLLFTSRNCTTRAGDIRALTVDTV